MQLAERVKYKPTGSNLEVSERGGYGEGHTLCEYSKLAVMKSRTFSLRNLDVSNRSSKVHSPLMELCAHPREDDGAKIFLPKKSNNFQQNSLGVR
jgi:hypothetical protein